MPPALTAQQIRAIARDFGFDFCRVAPAERATHEGVFEAEITNATPYRYVRVAKTANEGFLSPSCKRLRVAHVTTQPNYAQPPYARGKTARARRRARDICPARI
jgi:hypothetical protein